MFANLHGGNIPSVANFKQRTDITELRGGRKGQCSALARQHEHGENAVQAEVASPC